MNGHRDVIAKCVIVQDVDGEEEDNVDQPPLNWYLVGCHEERRSSSVELSNISGGSYKTELHKRQESSWRMVSPDFVTLVDARIPYRLRVRSCEDISNSLGETGQGKAYLMIASRA